MTQILHDNETADHPAAHDCGNGPAPYPVTFPFEIEATDASTPVPYAFRRPDIGSIESFADRDSAEVRALELGADGVAVTWIAWRRDEDEVDLPDLRDDPPSEDDRRFWARWSPVLCEPVGATDDEADRMAWMACWADLVPWDTYPGVGRWDEGRPFPDHHWAFSGLQDQIRVTVAVPAGEAVSRA